MTKMEVVLGKLKYYWSWSEPENEMGKLQYLKCICGHEVSYKDDDDDAYITLEKHAICRECGAEYRPMFLGIELVKVEEDQEMTKTTIRYGKDTKKLLKELAEKKGTSQPEIIRRALMTYKYFTDEISEGRVASVRSSSGEIIKDVTLP